MAGNPVIIQHSMNGGEVSARMEAREDQNKYLASLQTCVNFLPLTLGGVTRAPGFRFVAKAKFSGDAVKPEVRVMPFRFSNEQAYVLEVGDLYIRFFRNGAVVPDTITPTIPQEVVTPFTSGMLSLIQPFQSADVQYMPSGFFQVQKLSRISTSPDKFTFTQVNFDPPATIEDEPTGFDLGAGTLTLSATTGTSINFTAAVAPPFLAGDVGRLIISGGGRAIIKSITSTTVVVCDIIDNFVSVGPIPNTDWRMSGPYSSKIGVSTGIQGKTNTLTADINTFRASDVGKYIVIYGGTVKIDIVNSATSVTGTNKNQLNDFDDNNPPTGKTPAWTMEVTAWSDVLGFPTCGCFYQERMWLMRGQTLFGSVVGDFENFSKGSSDDSAIVRTISDDEINPIRWVKGLRTLLVGTGSAVFECTASAEGKPLTPNDFRVAVVSSRGSARIAPLRLGAQILYVQNGQKKLRELTFDILTNRYKSPSLLQLSEHLTEGLYITEVAYQQEPDSYVWATRNDGALLCLVYQEEEQVVGWARRVSDGRFRSHCTIPRPETGKDWHWVAVERDVNGSPNPETYIEFAEPDLSADDRGTREWTELQTDSAIVTLPTSDFKVTGLDHLEGKTVRVIGDGMLFEDQVVTGGQVSLDPQVVVNTVEAGLNYESVALTLEPVLPAEAGGPFLCRGYADVGVRIRRTLGLILNGEELVYRRPDDPMGAQIPLQRGKKCVMNLGYDHLGRIEIKQDKPFPAEILGIVGRLHIADRWLCDTTGEVLNVGNPPPPPSPPLGRVVIPFVAEINTPCIEFTGNEELFQIQNGCGFFVNLCTPSVYVGVDSSGHAYTQVKYQNAATGAAVSGPALSVDLDSTRALFQGYAAVYNSSSHIITLGKWNDQSLATIASTLGTVSVTLVDGDAVRIAKKQSDNSITVAVNGVTVITAMDSAIPFSNPGFGIIGVGTDEVSQNWSDFAVSCTEYVGSPGSEGDTTCCSGAPAGDLSIQCCSDTCEVTCAPPGDPADETAIVLRACGGTPPYFWNSTETAIVTVNQHDPSGATVYVAPLRAFMYAQVAYGVFVQPWPFQDLDKCSGNFIYPGAIVGCNCNDDGRPSILFLRPFQAEYDCAGAWLRNSLCTAEECSETEGTCAKARCPTTDSGQRATTDYSAHIQLGSHCFRNEYYPSDHLLAFSLGGLDGSSMERFHSRTACTGLNNQNCESPCFVGLFRDIGTYPGPCEYYILTDKRSVGAPVMEVTVQDSVGAIASVVIDVI